MTGYVSRLIARAKGAAASDAPAPMMPAFTPQFPPAEADTAEPAGPPPAIAQRDRQAAVTAHQLPSRRPELPPVRAFPAPVALSDAPADQREPTAKREIQPRAGAAAVRTGQATAEAADLFPSEEAAKHVLSEQDLATPPPAVAQGQDLAAPEPAPPSGAESAMHSQLAPDGVALPAAAAAGHIEGSLSNATKGPPPVPAWGSDLSASTPQRNQAGITRAEAPKLTIGRVDVIFEEPARPEPPKRAMPDRTSGFDGYDRVRSGRRR